MRVPSVAPFGARDPTGHLPSFAFGFAVTSPAPGSRLPAPGSRLPAPGSRFPVPGSRFLVPGSLPWALTTAAQRVQSMVQGRSPPAGPDPVGLVSPGQPYPVGLVSPYQPSRGPVAEAYPCSARARLLRVSPPERHPAALRRPASGAWGVGGAGSRVPTASALRFEFAPPAKLLQALPGLQVPGPPPGLPSEALATCPAKLSAKREGGFQAPGSSLPTGRRV